MEAYFWWSAYFGLILCSLIGAIIYSRKAYRKNINFTEIWHFFWIISALRVLDVLSTLRFVYKLGIEYEGNLVAKLFMTQFGIVPGIILIYVTSMPLLFFWLVLARFAFNGSAYKNKIWKLFKAVLLAISIIIPIVNMSA